MELNEDQENVLETVKNGKNILITGGAGVGKSFLIAEIKKYFYEQEIAFGTTAMTGSAAILINGRTLHSFMGIGLGKGIAEELVKKIKKRAIVLGDLLNLRALIIDEVSMLSDDLFDKIGKIFSILHKTNVPFGKVQVILVGDMSQLKPVQGDYCFKAMCWDACKFKVKILTKNMRVQNDSVFKDILNRLRWGVCTDDDLDTLNELRQTKFEDGIIPTRLFSINRDVDQINNLELSKLDGPFFTYKIKYPTNPIKLIESTKYITSQKIQETIKLCIGAQVIVTRNIDPDLGIVNGTRGVVTKLNNELIVIKLTDSREYPITFFLVQSEELPNIDFKYIPLKLGWAVSIHSSQGMTLDALEIDLGSSIFTEGQAYTGLSRARSLKDIKILKLQRKSFVTNKDVINFYSKINNCLNYTYGPTRTI